MMQYQTDFKIYKIYLCFEGVAEIVFKCIEQYEQGSLVFCACGSLDSMQDTD